jgi:hypothetical protein
MKAMRRLADATRNVRKGPDVDILARSDAATELALWWRDTAVAHHEAGNEHAAGNAAKSAAHFGWQALRSGRRGR